MASLSFLCICYQGRKLVFNTDLTGQIMREAVVYNTGLVYRASGASAPIARSGSVPADQGQNVRCQGLGMLERRNDLALANSQHGNGGIMMACEMEFWNVVDSGSIPELVSIS